MAKFKDFSEYKNNRLKYYFFQKALENYALEKEKNEDDKPKLKDNLIFTTLFTYIATEIDYLACLKNNHLILYLLTIIIIYFLLMTFYYLGVFPMYSYLKNKYENRKFNNTTDPDNLKNHEQRTAKAYLNKFNHEVSDQLAIAIDITNHLKDDRERDIENHFYTTEAFHCTKEATTTLLIILNSVDFSKKQGEDYKLINKHRIDQLIPLVEKITNKIISEWEKYGCNEHHQSELVEHKENIRLLKGLLN